MNFNRPRFDAFSVQEIRLAEAIAAQAALAIANARLYQQTLELSFTDPLTGVPNRRQLFLRLENELSRCLRFRRPALAPDDRPRSVQAHQRRAWAHGGRRRPARA